MDERDRCAVGDSRAQVVALPVALRSGAADQVDRLPLLFRVGGCKRGLFVELVVVDFLFALSSADCGTVGRVALCFLLLSCGRGTARSSRLVGKEEDPGASRRDGVSETNEYVPHFEVGERPYRHDSDPPALTVQAEP
jgi:hypothetical protein